MQQFPRRGSGEGAESLPQPAADQVDLPPSISCACLDFGAVQSACTAPQSGPRPVTFVQRCLTSRFQQLTLRECCKNILVAVLQGLERQAFWCLRGPESHSPGSVRAGPGRTQELHCR